MLRTLMNFRDREVVLDAQAALRRATTKAELADWAETYGPGAIDQLLAEIPSQSRSVQNDLFSR